MNQPGLTTLWGLQNLAAQVGDLIDPDDDGRAFTLWVLVQLRLYGAPDPITSNILPLLKSPEYLAGKVV